MMNKNYQNTRLFYLIFFFALVGSAISVISTLETIKTRSDIFFSGNFCRIGALFDCSSVYSSDEAVFLGIPVAFYGFIFFSWILFSNSLSRFGPFDQNSPSFLNLVLSTFAFLLCCYKALVMVFSIGSLCLLCISMYIVVVGIGLMVYRIFISTNERSAHITNVLKVLSVHSVAFVLYASLGIVLFLITNEVFARKNRFDVEVETREHFSQSKSDLVITDSTLSLGNRNAPIKLVEFIDFECPYCLRLLKQTKSLSAKFRNVIQVILVNYPLDKKVNPHIKVDFHQYAGLAAQTAICAAMHNKLSEFLDDLLNNPKVVIEEYLHDWVKRQEKDEIEYESCLQSEYVKEKLDNDIADATRNGIDATPFIFINGRQVNNWHYIKLLEKIVEAELNEKSSDN